MNVDRQVDRHQQENHALRSLLEISDQTCDYSVHVWKNNKPCRKYKSTHKAKAIDSEMIISKSQKLPLIPNKSNLNHQPLIRENSKVNHCLIIDKGLGAFNSVQIKKGKGRSRYVDSSSYLRLYSESTDQEIELITNWLNLKKESCKSYQSILRKKKAKLLDNATQHLSIKHLL